MKNFLIKNLSIFLVLWGLLIVFNDGEELWLENATHYYLNNGSFWGERYTYYVIFCGETKCGIINYEKVKYIIKKPQNDSKRK